MSLRRSYPILVATLTVWALAASAAPTGAAAFPTPVDGSRTGTETLFPDQGNGGYNVLHYDVKLAYAPARQRLVARARITARANQPLASYSLDLEGLRVRSVKVNGKNASFLREGDELVVRPRRAVRGVFTTTVSYVGQPTTHIDSDGSSEGWVPTPDGATALGEPVGTMTWLPSNNTPGDKATYTFRIRVPSHLKAAANGVLKRRVKHGRSTTWVWREAEPMSTYLAVVSIGKFDFYQSSTKSITGRRIPIWSFVDSAVQSSGAARRMLPKVIRFGERLFGPYPFRSAGMIIDDADTGYALETQARPFYPFAAVPSTIVHETAHQWYGNSVTLTDWHDIWLAEGFATYTEWLWEARHGGKTPAEQFDELYATAASDPLWQPAPTQFTDPGDLFGSRSYDRGGMTLQVLRERVGSRDYFRILKAWATQNRHGNVRTVQFVRLAERVSGEQLDTLFADWLEFDGRPAGY